MPESWITSWRWSAVHVGWFAHAPAFTAFVAYERQVRPPGEEWRPAGAVDGAANATRYAVAIVGPWRDVGSGVHGWTERYALRGSLNEVRDKLIAALERRQRAYNTREQEVTNAAIAA